ncbi:MAG TPA: hypothetical protein VHH36_06910, partial [Candidatus Thermoplasmatota archaeon]|nr:hypothetical protein [Candidatus Thermoplasmatota archaeon]
RLVIDDREAPAVTLLSPIAPVPKGQAARIEARVVDAIGVARAEAVVTQPDGERILLPLAHQGNDVFAATFQPRLPGEHRLEIRAEDGADPVNVAQGSPTTFVVQAGAYRGFKPANFQDGKTFRGTTLRFQEMDPGTTRNLTIDLGEGHVPLAFPYETNVTWPEGKHTMRLRARSIDNVTWEAQYNVTIDRTPPTLSDAAVKPSGAQVQLSVTAPDAANVTARFATPGGTVEVPLSATGGGRFAKTVTPPAGWTNVTFVATDAAGNAGSASLENEGSKDAPGPGAALAALALAAAAFAYRAGRKGGKR